MLNLWFDFWQEHKFSFDCLHIYFAVIMTKLAVLKTVLCI